MAYNPCMHGGSQDHALRVGQMAQLTGLSTDTLRRFERKGLLVPGRSSNGYREYSPEAVQRIRLVQRALSVGFTLDELARVVRIRERGGAPCREVRALAAANEIEGFPPRVGLVQSRISAREQVGVACRRRCSGSVRRGFAQEGCCTCAGS
jgi:DNA-binding transcriptional MerR regulator